MHYSQHTRTGCNIGSALPRQGQALSFGRGKSLFDPRSISNGVCLAVSTIVPSLLPATAAYLQSSTAEDSNVWKKQGLETDGNRPTLLEQASIHQHNATEKLFFVVSGMSTRISTDKQKSESAQEHAEVGHLPNPLSES